MFNMFRDCWNRCVERCSHVFDVGVLCCDLRYRKFGSYWSFQTRRTEWLASSESRSLRSRGTDCSFDCEVITTKSVCTVRRVDDSPLLSLLQVSFSWGSGEKIGKLIARAKWKRPSKTPHAGRVGSDMHYILLSNWLREYDWGFDFILCCDGRVQYQRSRHSI